MKHDSLCCDNLINNDDCAICFNFTNNTVAPCGHVICETCIEKWYRKKSCLKCPVCRQTLHSFNGKIIHDADFVMFCGESDNYGITLKKCTDGVVVVKTVKNDIAQTSGLKKNTVITHINGIQVNNHENAIKILDSAKLHKCSVYINVLKKKEKNLTKRYFSFKPW